MIQNNVYYLQTFPLACGGKFETENESEHDMLKLLGNPSDVEQMKNQM